jgi:DNA-binding MarR family transcriptional regulator
MNFYQQLGFLVFGSRLKRLSDSFLNDVNRIYRKHKIGFDASWFPVFYILSTREEISIRNISDELGISHSAVSQLISSLQKKGLIRSVVSKTDARHKVITFTVKGQKLLAKIEPVWNALKQAMEELANENAQSKKILDALTVMEKNLQQQSVFDRVENFLK